MKFDAALMTLPVHGVTVAHQRELATAAVTRLNTLAQTGHRSE
jgi:hypothetical protein